MYTIFIIDIDTTIANNDHRAALLERECLVCLSRVKGNAQCVNCGAHESKIVQSSWDKFLSPELLSKDTPVPKAQDAIYKMRSLGMDFAFITGRNESLREATEEWLAEHFGYDKTKEYLGMRQASDNGAASVVKERLLKEFIEKRGLDLHKVRFIFMEDDPYVFRMYQQYGIVIRCPEGWEHWLPDAKTDLEPRWRR